MEQETICELRRISVFLRLVLFFFTLISWEPPLRYFS
jgi:hypothetical protein